MQHANNRKWSDLTSKEFKKIYPVIEANAQRHFKCAKILADAGEPQNAIAHLILGTEELIKAFGCLLMARELSVKRQSWFNKLFYNHQTRHDLVKDFFSLYLLINSPSSPSKTSSGFWSSLGKILAGTVLAAGNYFWWQNADDLKKRTLYVDYNNKLIDPSSIDFQQYSTALVYVSRFEKDITKLMREIETSPHKILKEWERQMDLTQIDKLRQEAYKIK